MITRSDLSFGQITVQSTHSIADFAHTFPNKFYDWKSESNSIICLSVNSEKELIKLYNKFNIITESVMFFEPDIDSYTSICLYGSSDVRRKLRYLPLIKNSSLDESK